ncbi:MAG: hypothetical protein JSS02_02780 [Planctomycetes bacterium]|nr:hypothetical protein [Planctomycetota bacterium]
MAPPTVTRSRKNLWITLLFALAVLIPSLYGFSGKFIEFVAVFRGESDGQFAITPIVNYLLATLGFFCLFGWAIMHGMFSDIERPKQVFLEQQEWLDQQLLAAQTAPSAHRNSAP